MRIKLTLVFCFFMFPVFSKASEIFPEIHYKLQWQTDNGIENNVDVILSDNKISAVAKSGNSDKDIWSLKDYVEFCELDSVLDIIPESFESVDLFHDDNKVVLFAYKIGCVGGVDPVDVKYFAFYKGKKYALRGQEIFISDTGVDEGYNEPKPDDKLKHNERLLKYMQKRWPTIASKIMF